MAEFLAKARAMEREKGISFREACSRLGQASAKARRHRKAKAQAAKRTRPEAGSDWHTRWERERERIGESETA